MRRRVLWRPLAARLSRLLAVSHSISRLPPRVGQVQIRPAAQESPQRIRVCLPDVGASAVQATCTVLVCVPMRDRAAHSPPEHPQRGISIPAPQRGARADPDPGARADHDRSSRRSRAIVGTGCQDSSPNLKITKRRALASASSWQAARTVIVRRAPAAFTKVTRCGAVVIRQASAEYPQLTHCNRVQ